MNKIIIFMAIISIIGCSSHRPYVSDKWDSVTVDSMKIFNRITKRYDTDKDKKITIKDSPKTLKLSDKIEVKGAYPVSIVLEKVIDALDNNQEKVEIKRSQLVENPVDRTNRLIKVKYWRGLTRTLDLKGLEKVFKDSKVKSQEHFYIYVPHTDTMAYNYYRWVKKKVKDKKIHVKKLPRNFDAKDVRELDGKHGVLSLQLETTSKGVKGTPFVVPGGRFNEMYGWDSYFIILGLLQDEKVDLARSMVENLTYQIKNYGKVLNANRSYYLNRSQPPFTTSAINAVYSHLPKNSINKGWYQRQMRLAYLEYKTVWMSSPRLTQTGLSRYHAEGRGPCPEVEKGHYDHILGKYAKDEGISAQSYYDKISMQLKNDRAFKLPQELETYFVHDRSIRESGHDTTYRFDNRTSDFLPVDLNSLLAKYESDFAQALEDKTLSKSYFGSAKSWRAKFEKRRMLMLKYLWNENDNQFYDYDFKNFKLSGFDSATSFYPMWAKIVGPSMAKDLVNSILPKLEQKGGVAGASRESTGAIGPYHPQRQWDYPFGWAPHQVLIWQGLENYNLHEIKERLIYKWIKMITDNAKNYNSMIVEKYDVDKQSHLVFAEYGNVGMDFDYITREGFGWMNASYQIGLSKLSTKSLEKLKNEYK